jgi:hypothetical protein
MRQARGGAWPVLVGQVEHVHQCVQFLLGDEKLCVPPMGVVRQPALGLQPRSQRTLQCHLRSVVVRRRRDGVHRGGGGRDAGSRGGKGSGSGGRRAARRRRWGGRGRVHGSGSSKADGLVTSERNSRGGRRALCSGLSMERSNRRPTTRHALGLATPVSTSASLTLRARTSTATLQAAVLRESVQGDEVGFVLTVGIEEHTGEEMRHGARGAWSPAVRTEVHTARVVVIGDKVVPQHHRTAKHLAYRTQVLHGDVTRDNVRASPQNAYLTAEGSSQLGEVRTLAQTRSTEGRTVVRGTHEQQW